MRIRAYPVLISFVLITCALVIGLRGTAHQSTAYQTDSLQNATSLQGVSFGNVLWSDNFTETNWYLSAPNNTEATVQVNHSLYLNVTFTSQEYPQSIVAWSQLNISLDKNPVVITELAVTVGVHYGVRFSGITPDSANFDAWHEASKLQHRPGLGFSESVSTNLALETYMANGHPPIPGSRITRIWFYVEATPGTSGQFSMQVTSLRAFSLDKTKSSSMEIMGNLEGVVIDLDLPPVTQSLFQAYVGFDIRGTPDLQYTPFFVSGGSVLAQGFTYVQNRLTTYEVAVLLPSLALGFPPFLSDRNSIVIIIGAKAGEINYFKLESLSFKFTSTPARTDGFVDPNVARLFIGYYVLFLFVTPVAAVILLTRVFKPET